MQKWVNYKQDKTTPHAESNVAILLLHVNCNLKTVFFFQFLLDIFFIYISNTILKVPYTLPRPAPLPTHSNFLDLVFPCTGAYKVCYTKGPLFPTMAN